MESSLLYLLAGTIADEKPWNQREPAKATKQQYIA
jgi:hypothetical protein